MTGRVAESAKSLRAAVWWSIITLLGFLAIDFALSCSGSYLPYIDPNSSSGQVEDRIYWLRSTPPAKVSEIAVIGDSRVADGFSAPVADATSGNRLRYWNFGVPGMNPRVWDYVFREADPDRNRFRAVVLAIDHYTDDDDAEFIMSDRISDLRYSAALLRPGDCLDFAASFRTWENRPRALAGCLFKGLVLGPAIRGLLLNPYKHLKSVSDFHVNGLRYLDSYTGIDRNMVGLSADSNRGEIHFPPGVDLTVQLSARLTITPKRLPYAGETTRYRQQWLGRVMDRYRGTRTKVIFFQLPRAPIPVPEHTAPERFIESVANLPGVFVTPESTFRNFEKPELFADGLHLNATARIGFSKALAGVVAGVPGVQ
jgi:hypothetical protein